MYHLSEGKSVPIRSWTLDMVRELSDIYSIFPGRLSVTLSVTECYSTRRHFAETSVHTEYIKTKSRPDSTRILIWDFSSFHFSVNTVPTSMFIGFLSLNHMETFLLPCMSDLFNFYFKISNFIICLAICWILQHNQNKKGTNLYHVHNHLVFIAKEKSLSNMSSGEQIESCQLTKIWRHFFSTSHTVIWYIYQGETVQKFNSTHPGSEIKKKQQFY